MNTLEFEINTKPVPQARPRFFIRKNGNGQSVGAYDPKKCKIFKEIVAWEARAAALQNGIREPLRNPISIDLTFQMGRNGKEQHHTKKPDLSNLMKIIEDALNKIIYVDDSQIVEARLRKVYGKHCIKVKIEALEV